MTTKRKPDDDNGFGDWGGYMNAKIAKLEEQFVIDAVKNQAFKKSDLFNGISIFVNGYTNPSSDELKRIMMLHGGTYHTYRRSHTTFTIATNLPDTKIRQLTTEKIIRPDWVVDCLKANRILDYAPYLLYTNEKESQPGLQRFLKNVKGDTKPEVDRVDPVQANLELLNLKLNTSDTRCPSPKNSSIIGFRFPKDEHVAFSEHSEQEVVQVEERKDNIPDQGPDEGFIDAPLEQPLKESPNKQDPSKERVKNATDPNFLAEFFKNSRLHHIATLGAGFKQYVNDLREKHRGGGFPERRKLAGLKKAERQTSLEKTIMHIDMDCFFVSVGLRNRQHLRGLPVAVTHSKGNEGGKPMPRPGANRQLEAELYRKRLEERYDKKDEDPDSNIDKIEKKVNALESASSLSEIASCSYEARKFGIHNGMFVGSALKLCPQLKTIPYDFESYKEVAYSLYDTIAKYTLDIEAVSCDEMYVDMTELLVSTKADTMELVKYIRNEIKEITGCPCSAGIGKNKLQARLATKEAKPDGQHYLTNVSEYIKSVPITELPGVGYSTSFKLEKLGFKTCGELQRLTLPSLQQDFGNKTGETLYHFCRGIDNRYLVYDHVRKSVSVDVNYGIRFTENTEVEFFLRQVCEELHRRLAEIQQKGKCLTLKILVRAQDAPVETAKYLGTGMCDAINKTAALTFATYDTEIISNTVINLMRSLKLPPHELRGIGVQMSKLTSIGGRETAGVTLKDMFKKVEAKNKMAHDTNHVPKPSTSNVTRSEPDCTTPVKRENESIKSDSRKHTPLKSETPSKRSSFPTSRRGRPRKIPQVQSNASRTIMSMFNRVKSFDELDLPSSSKEKLPEELSDLDPEVLAGLPEDIRQEVIREHRFMKQQERMKQQQKQLGPVQAQKPKPSPKITDPKPGTSNESTSSSMITVDEKFLDALPTELRKEVEEQINLQQSTIRVQKTEAKETQIEESEQSSKPDNIFLKSEFKTALTNWMDAFEDPSAEDIDILAVQAANMVELRELPTLYLALRFFHRKVSEERRSCGWHKSYLHVVDSVQMAMRTSKHYRYRLEVKTKFPNCNNCLSQSQP